MSRKSRNVEDFVKSAQYTMLSDPGLGIGAALTVAALMSRDEELRRAVGEKKTTKSTPLSDVLYTAGGAATGGLGAGLASAIGRGDKNSLGHRDLKLDKTTALTALAGSLLGGGAGYMMAPDEFTHYELPDERERA